VHKIVIINASTSIPSQISARPSCYFPSLNLLFTSSASFRFLKGNPLVLLSKPVVLL